MAVAGGREVQIDGLSLEQLQNLKQQLEGELQQMTQSLRSLRDAQDRFKDSKASLGALKPENAGREILVPLTQSLYVSGSVADVTEVMVDIGTGYFASKTVEQAGAFMDRKIEYLTRNIGSLDEVVQTKRANLETLVSVMQERVMQAERAQAQASA